MQNKNQRIPTDGVILSSLITGAFVCLLFFWVRGGNFDQLWMQRWAILLVSSALVLAYNVGKRVSWYFAPITFTSLFSGIAASYWFNRYDNKAMEGLAVGISNPALFSLDDKWAIQAVLRQDASRALATFLFLFILFRTINLKTASSIRTYLGLCGLIEAGVILAHPTTARYWVPFFDNPSMAGSFIALSLFALNGDINHFVGERWKFRARTCLWAICLGAIALVHASTPLLALAGGGLAWLIAKMHKDKNYVWAIFPMIAGIFFAGYFMQGAELWNDNSRFNMWRWSIEYWQRQGPFTKFFGFGTGTMRALMPLAEVEHGMSTGWYFWLHNDWLQILIEQGTIGWAALVTASVELVRRAIKWPDFLACLGCFGAIMLTGFPLHWPVFVLMLGTLVRPFLEEKQMFMKGSE